MSTTQQRPRPCPRSTVTRRETPHHGRAARRAGTSRWNGDRPDGVSRFRRGRTGGHHARQQRQPLLHAHHERVRYPELGRRPGHAVHRHAYRPGDERRVGDRRRGHRVVRIRRPASRLRESSSQSFTSFVPTGFPPVQATTPGASAPNCLEYVNSDLSAVVANGSALPTIAPQPNTTRTSLDKPGGDYPTVSGQALAEIGQGGQQTAPGFQQPFGQLPAQSAVHVRRCRLDGECAHSEVGPTSISWGCTATFLDPSAGLVCNGPAPGQIASASPDRLSETLTQLGIDACQSGTGGGQGLTDNLGAGLQRRRGAVRLCQRQRRPGLQRSRLRGIGVGLLTGELSRWRGACASLRCHTDRVERGGARTQRRRAAIAALQRLRDCADRLFAAQDHPRSVRPAPEQWRRTRTSRGADK